MNDSPFIFTVDESNFTKLVIEASQRQPVLVDFWAEWCAPCRSLMPVLATLAQSYQGKFILAKVNSDENQTLAAQYGVRSLPTVKMFKGGSPVDEFMGALPESAIRQFLERHVEHESDRLHARGMQAYRQGSTDVAVELLQQAHALEPDKLRIRADLAALLAESGDLKQAQELLDALPEYERNQGEVASLLARIEFECAAATLPSEGSLASGVAGGELNALYQMALLRISQSEFADAMELLLSIIRKDRGYQDDLGRKTLLKLFAMLGDDPLVEVYRRKMTNLLF